MILNWLPSRKKVRMGGPENRRKLWGRVRGARKAQELWGVWVATYSNQVADEKVPRWGNLQII